MIELALNFLARPLMRVFAPAATAKIEGIATTAIARVAGKAVPEAEAVATATAKETAEAAAPTTMDKLKKNPVVRYGPAAALGVDGYVNSDKDRTTSEKIGATATGVTAGGYAALKVIKYVPSAMMKGLAAWVVVPLAYATGRRVGEGASDAKGAIDKLIGPDAPPAAPTPLVAAEKTAQAAKEAEANYAKAQKAYQTAIENVVKDGPNVTLEHSNALVNSFSNLTTAITAGLAAQGQTVDRAAVENEVRRMGDEITTQAKSIQEAQKLRASGAVQGGDTAARVAAPEVVAGLDLGALLSGRGASQ